MQLPSLQTRQIRSSGNLQTREFECGNFGCSSSAGAAFEEDPQLRLELWERACLNQTQLRKTNSMNGKADAT